MAGDVDIAPARRLLQAVCYPGHAILMHDARVVLSTGDAAVLAGLERVAAQQPEERSFTIGWTDALVACVTRRDAHTLIVVVPSELDVTRVHEKMRSAIDLYARDGTAMPWTPSGGGSGSGGSGAPAELFVRSIRPRPS